MTSSFESSLDPRALKSIGGKLCLGLANTLNWRNNPRKIEERIPDYAALLKWGVKTGLLRQKEERELHREAQKRKGEAQLAHDKIILLRETLYRIFSAEAARHRPRAADLDTLNSMLSEALLRLRIGAAKRRFEWVWTGWGNTLECLLWPVLQSAGDLLAGPDLARLRECEGPACGWLFLDTSRNHMRRWCDMKDCGNIVKARRFYARKHSRR